MSKARRITREESTRAAEEVLGKPGGMLYLSKSRGKPTTMFNAIIFNSNAKQIWAGDLEILLDKEALFKALKESRADIRSLRGERKFHQIYTRH